MSNTLLIIDDSTDLRENTCELLELAGYKVYSAENGKVGLERAREIHPDLILCDIMMPELNGYGVLRALENIPELQGTPFVFLTAKSEKSDIREGMDLGADDYLTKPFTGDDLLRVIKARLTKNVRNKSKHSEDINRLMSGECDLDDLHALSANRTIKKMRARDIVFMEGDSALYLYYVVSGKFKLYKTNEWGKEYITKIAGAGDFLGHQALLINGPYKKSAEALENSELAIIPRQEFFDQLYSNNALSLMFNRYLAREMTESEEKLLQLAYNSARKRVAEALLFTYHQYKKEENPEFQFPVSRENLSGIAAISPESVSRNLTDFREENLILTDNGNIRILDFRKLSELRS